MSAWLEWVVEHHDRPWLERVAITRAEQAKLPVATWLDDALRIPAHPCKGPGCERWVMQVAGKHGRVASYCSTSCYEAMRSVREKARRAAARTSVMPQAAE